MKKAIYMVVFFAWLTPVLAQEPNDPGYRLQRPMWTQINAPAAWDLTVGSNNVVVAVIDTGADIWHEDLSQNMWLNPYEIPDNGIDDDRNGYVDDMHGWNFVEQNNNLHASVNASSTDQDAESTTHGTLVAGLVGALGNNALDGTGLNWRVKIMPLRAIESNGSGKYSDVIRAVRYATDNGANVIVMSFVGDERSLALEDALHTAYERGVVVVAAAGNHESTESGNFGDTPRYPACFNQDYGGNWMLTVGSVDASDRLSSFSNYGSCLNIVAPGENIYSDEWYAPAQGYNTAFGGLWFGTSFAAPLVGGAAALIKSIHPDWSAQRIIQTLLDTSDPIHSPLPELSGVGRLNVGRAIAVANATTPLPSLWHQSLYALQKNTVRRYDPGDTKAHDVLTVNGAVLAAASVRHDPGTYLFVLSKQAGSYYLTTATHEGKVLSLRRVVPPKLSGALRSVSMQASLDTEGAPRLAFNWVDSGKRSTVTFTHFSGVMQSQHIIKPAITAWSYNALSGDFVYAELKGGALTAVRVNWESGETHRTPVDTSVVAADSVYIVSGGVALTYRTGRDARLATVDLTSDTVAIAVPGRGAQTKAWYIWALRNSFTNQVALVSFPAGAAGERIIFDQNLVSTDTINVPTISGLIVR